MKKMCDTLTTDHTVSVYTQKACKIILETGNTSGDTSAIVVSDVVDTGDTAGDTSAIVVSDSVDTGD